MFDLWELLHVEDVCCGSDADITFIFGDLGAWCEFCEG